MAEIYSRFWIQERSVNDQLSPYDDRILKFIDTLCNKFKYKDLLEVAVGTGLPFAKALSEKGYNIHGIDISSILIDECRINAPLIISSVGNAEDLCFDNNRFDLVYCMHSTWYFDNIYYAISEMIRTLKPGGTIIFDIQNLSNQ